MGAGQSQGLAAKNGVARTIPTHVTVEAVTASEGSVSLAAHGGRWLYLRSDGSTITLLRRASSPTLVDGQGMLVSSAQAEEVFVDPGGEMTLWHISSGAVNLLIAYDSEQH